MAFRVGKWDEHVRRQKEGTNKLLHILDTYLRVIDEAINE